MTSVNGIRMAGMHDTTAAAREMARLDAIARYAILDTPPDEAFDALTSLAARVLRVPIALVTIVDAGRAWFKARHGLTEASMARTEVFCDDVVRAGAAIVVPDTLADPRYRQHPLVVREPGIRFYAGVPLRTPDGQTLGTFCVLDRAPRRLEGPDLAFLQHVADETLVQLERHREQVAASGGERSPGPRAARRKSPGQRREGDVGRPSETSPTRRDTTEEERTAAAVAAERAGIAAALAQLPGLTITLFDADLGFLETFGAAHASGAVSDTLGPLRAAAQRCLGGEKVRLLVRDDSRLLNVQFVPLAFQGTSERGLFVARDVTEIEQLREQVSSQQRLVTTGTLAAGVGHEINNPLTYVVSNLEYALTSLEKLEPPGGRRGGREVLGALRDAHEGADRIGRIVKGLRTLARGHGEKKPVDVRGVVEDAITVAQHEVRLHARLDIQLAPVGPVLADEASVSQVCVNLLVNAAQAFRCDDHHRNLVVVRTFSQGDRVIFEVEDNGHGIAPEVLPRIYDPFFTTRPAGQGTGLGLSISHRLVAAMGGELTCRSVVDEGTCFRVSLPVVKAPARKRGASGSP